MRRKIFQGAAIGALVLIQSVATDSHANERKMSETTDTGMRLAAAEPATPPARPQDTRRPVTGDSVDPLYTEPFIQVDEQRTKPIPHRYVHGGFKGSDMQFSFYFPPKEIYKGRFFHNTYPLAVTSDIAPFPIAFEVAIGDLGFTFDSGAYYVQTAGGRDLPYRVNAAAAKYSRVLAAEYYGAHRPYGYLFGGSGGSYQVMGAAEATSGVWDGFVPYVLGTPNSVPSMFTARLHAMRILKQRNKFPGIVDAVDPGGSGDPYAGLNDEERAALKEATLLGFPLRGWWDYANLTSGYYQFVSHLTPMIDSTYAADFWSKPGYLGTDPASSVRAARFQFDTTIANVVDGSPPRLELASVPEKNLADAHLIFVSGAAAGKRVSIASAKGKTIVLVTPPRMPPVSGMKAGDQVQIDNSWLLAMQTYQRHQLPTSDMYGWNQFRNADGAPIYPQRRGLVGATTATGPAGASTVGHITGKVLAVEALMDIDAFPWQADWYKSAVQKALGPKFADNFVLWYIDHAQHDNPPPGPARTRVVSLSGALQQALRDMSAWAEKGVRPPDTVYKVVDTQVEVPASAKERKGIQPVVALKANGGVRADVAVNEPVTFTAMVEVPPGAGKVVSAEWDFEGAGDYPVKAQIKPGKVIQLSAKHSFPKPGTYFPVLHAVSQREGDTKTRYGRIENIARVRVVVK